MAQLFAKQRREGVTGDGSERALAMDFVHDQLATGGRFRALTIVDTFSRFSPALAPTRP
jgi:putative transposase